MAGVKQSPFGGEIETFLVPNPKVFGWCHRNNVFHVIGPDRGTDLQNASWLGQMKRQLEAIPTTEVVTFDRDGLRIVSNGLLIQVPPPYGLGLRIYAGKDRS